MPKNRKIHRISDTKRSKPKIKFNGWMLVVIFALSFAGCFILYMTAANLDDDFFADESSSSSEISDSVIETTDDAVQDITSESVSSTSEVETVVRNPIAETTAADESYLSDCLLITDSILIDTAVNGRIGNVIGNAELTAYGINDVKIESSNGTITAYEIVKLKKPKNIYIMLGSDLAVNPPDDMISSLSTFLANTITALPDTNIYIMQIPPIYMDTETITNEMINDYNSKLLKLADSKGVYCIDTNTELKNNNGTLDEAYYSADTDKLNSSGFDAICNYILTHTVK